MSSAAAALTKRALHPSGKELIFESKWHRYTMTGLGIFSSVSNVLDRSFPFDAQRIAQFVANKSGRTVEAVMAEWKLSATLGTNTHAHIEALLRNAPPPTTFEVTHGNEAFFCKAGEQLVKDVLADFEPVAIEYMLCHPQAAVAGTVDFIGRHKTTGQILVADWKTSASWSSYKFGDFDERCPVVAGFHGSGSTTGVLSHLSATKMNRYALQIFLYGRILQSQDYATLLKEPAINGPLLYMIGMLAPEGEDSLNTIVPRPSMVTLDGVLPPVEQRYLAGDYLPHDVVLDRLLGVPNV